MFGTRDLDMLLRMQAELRRDAAQQRLAAKHRVNEPRKARTRRVFGLRLSLA